MNPANAIPATFATTTNAPSTTTPVTNAFDKTVFDPATRAELIKRIGALHTAGTRQWGSMTLYQMLKHCTLWDEMAHGKKRFKRVPLGLILGKKALRDLLKEGPFARNMPSVRDFMVTGDGDTHAESVKWIILIKEYASFSNPGFFHPFFGKVTREQTGILAYKHADHHLRQFGL
jgi:hypothetical protein